MPPAIVSESDKQKIFLIYGDTEQPLTDSSYTHEENVDLLQEDVEDATRYADSETRKKLVEICALSVGAFANRADFHFEKLKLQATEIANLASVNRAYATTISSVSFFEAAIERHTF